MTSTPRPHGTHARYRSGCRCRPCKDASAARQRDSYRLKAYGQWQPYVDAGPARAHVRALMDYGAGYKRVAEAAGVSVGALSRLLWGGGACPPARQIRPETAARLLAVRPALALLRPGRDVDGTGTRRRLQALIAAGHCRVVLAGRLGMIGTNFNRILRTADRVHAATALAAGALYDELWDAAPDESEPRAARRAARARREARANGWPPPAAWDDQQIDSPAAAPAEGWERHDGKLRDSAALAEDATELIEQQGYDRVTAAARLGVSRHALDKAFSRTAAAWEGRSDAA